MIILYLNLFCKLFNYYRGYQINNMHPLKLVDQAIEELDSVSRVLNCP